MSHTHDMLDSDPRFSIDTATREITYLTEYDEVPILVQGDHNSQHFTFELPRYIDGHDMTLCNKNYVNYINISSENPNTRNTGIYEVVDLKVDPEDNDKVLCTWVISGGATTFVGNLSFVVRFTCVTDDVLDYAWNTTIYSETTVVAGIMLDEVFEQKYTDILESWRRELVDAGEYSVEAIESRRDEVLNLLNSTGGIVMSPTEPEDENILVWLVDLPEDEQETVEFSERSDFPGIIKGEGPSSIVQIQGGAKNSDGWLDFHEVDGELTDKSVAKGINDALFGSCHKAFGDNNFAAGRKNKTYQNSSIALGSSCTAGNEALQNEYDTQYKDIIDRIHINNPQGEDESDKAYEERITGLIEQETGKSSGNLSFIYYSGSVAMGVTSKATGRASTASGLGCNASGDYSHAEGEQTEAKRAWSHAEGYKTQAEGQASHAEGYMVISRGDRSHAEGYQTQALELQSHSEGRETIAAGRSSHAEGYITQANGTASHSEGCGAIANGDYSHAEGNRTQTVGSYSHAEGSGTLSSGNCAHSEGLSSRAKGEASHAEGVDTEAGYGAHAEGCSSVASGSYAHAEGNKTIAEWGAHAEGNQTNALGSASHSEGYLTTASGQYSHAEGHKTEAVGNGQHVQGRYNIIDVVMDESGNSNYAHIIGNGTATKRSNAHTVDWSGNAWYAGSVQAVGGIILKSPNGKLFKLVVSDDGILSTQEVI